MNKRQPIDIVTGIISELQELERLLAPKEVQEDITREGLDMWAKSVRDKVNIIAHNYKWAEYKVCIEQPKKTIEDSFFRNIGNQAHTFKSLDGKTRIPFLAEIGQLFKQRI